MPSKRFLGEPDAAADPRFSDHFVPQEELQELLSPQSHIIYGAKGVGKTAMRRAISEIHRHRFYSTGTIDLDTLSFEKVHRALASLSATTGEEIMALARTIWRNVLIGYCLEFVKDRLPEDFATYDEIQQLLRDEQFVDRKAPDRVLNQIDRFFMAIGSLGIVPAPEPRLPLNEKQRLALGGFASSGPLADLLRDCVAIVADTRRPVAVCIDGFDSIVDHERQSRRAIFAGLVDAIYRFSRDRDFSKAFCFKVFLPRELTYEAQDIAWDADKFLHADCLLHWNEDSLKEFLLKRLRRHAKAEKRSSPAFDVTWSEFMPPMVRNMVHGVDEPSLDYILRHTQFRPRQLLFQLQSILDAWDAKSSEFRVAAGFIPGLVEKSSRKLSHVTAAQLEYARPGLRSFLRSWGGTSITITFAECFLKIKKIFQTDASVTAQEVFDDLFEFGILGVARPESIEAREALVKVRFSYVGHGARTKVQPADDDIIAMCPMFADYFACLPSKYGVVKPVAV
jgi:hypothetical protein